MIHIALFEPEIPPNTGNIIRLCVNTGFALHLIEPLTFSLEDRYLRRAGLDYHAQVTVRVHPDFEAFLQYMAGKRIFSVTTKADTDYTALEFRADDVLLFGPETRGLPAAIRTRFQQIRIPMRTPERSINLANAVSIVAYEAWRQLGFSGRLD
ncbi:MAG: tRNA (cytidine(34)-2'-O)-methyltransferase [Fidelibacterota bacterium]